MKHQFLMLPLLSAVVVSLPTPSAQAQKSAPAPVPKVYATPNPQDDLTTLAPVKTSQDQPPGRTKPQEQSEGVSSKERQALVALYNATGGTHWEHHGGWLGPPGTECNWEGITCDPGFHESAKVVALDLYQNNLVGVIPEVAGQLTHLDSLMIWDNRLSGQLPALWIKRWLSGALSISAEAALLTDISDIEFESNATSVLCASHRIALRSDGSAVLLTEKCRNATPGDRTTFCEVQEGRLGPQDFARLGWLLEKNGFFSMQSHYSRSMTHAAFETTRVVRRGKSYEVENYASAGPFELWVVQRAVESMAGSIEWEKTSTEPECQPSKLLPKSGQK